MKSSRTLRRVAWALDMPMTRTIESVFEYLPRILDSDRVCQACRDRSKCADCGFNSDKQNQDGKEVIEQGKLVRRRYNEVGAPDNRITGIKPSPDAPDKDLYTGIGLGSHRSP